MKKLLTATVSWQRPELCKKMIESFIKTKTIADLFVYICDDDPKLEEYKPLIKEFPEIKFEIGPHLFIAEVSNYIPIKFMYEYYQMVNDDHEFMEKKWDIEMIAELDKHNGWRLAASYMPEELMVSKVTAGPLLNAPTAEIFSRKIIKALGFYNFPEFKQYGCDLYIMELGEALGGILYFTGKIYHNPWHGLERMEKDATAEFIYSDENMKQGNYAINLWSQNKKEIINRVLRAKNEAGY